MRLLPLAVDLRSNLALVNADSSSKRWVTNSAPPSVVRLQRQEGHTSWRRHQAAMQEAGEGSPETSSQRLRKYYDPRRCVRLHRLDKQPGIE